MEVTATQETTPTRPEPTSSTPATPAEGPRDPSKRRFLKAVGKVGLGAVAVGAGVKLGFLGTDVINSLFPPAEPVKKTPEPPPVQTDIPASEKAINKVPLAEITKKQGFMALVPLPFKPTDKDPYGFELSFQDLTIVDIVNADTPSGLWVALAMPGDGLQRSPSQIQATNFDGTKTQLYTYKGFTAWIYIDGRTSVFKGSKVSLGNGVSVIKPLLEKGQPMSVTSFITQYGERTFQNTNLNSYNLLSENLGKPNSDRSDQTFKFVANDIALRS